MNWNKLNLKVVQKVLLDSKYVDDMIVEIKFLTRNGMFALVEQDGESWEVMTNRLKPILKG